MRRNPKLNELFRKLKSNKFAFLKNYRIPKNFKRKMPEFPPIYKSRIDCKTEHRKFYNTQGLINPIKSKYCRKAYKTIAYMNKMNPKIVLANLANQARKLWGLKRTFYCAICDAEKQEFFDGENGLIYFSQNFCKDLIHTFKDYIMFNNVLFVDFADDLL